MLKRFLHSVVSYPFVYDQVQVFFGARKRREAVLRYYPNVTKSSKILDLGGGTGFYRDLWPKHCLYICLDNDLVKLNGLINRCPHDFVANFIFLNGLTYLTDQHPAFL